MSTLFARVTPRRPAAEPVEALELTSAQRATAHMAASVLLDYPDDAWRAQLPTLRAQLAVPDELRAILEEFLDEAEATDAAAWQCRYVETFDLKRKCSLYLSYYAAGDTRRRGTALVTFLEAYRAAGWEFDAQELPDFLPAVLEFSALSDSPVASALLAAHREGIEVLRAALESMHSPWALPVKAVTLSLPPIDEDTRERYLALVNEGPPTETVGLSFLGSLPPFTPTTARSDGAQS